MYRLPTNFLLGVLCCIDHMASSLQCPVSGTHFKKRTVSFGHEAGSPERQLSGSPFHAIGPPDSGYPPPTPCAAQQSSNSVRGTSALGNDLTSNIPSRYPLSDLCRRSHRIVTYRCRNADPIGVRFPHVRHLPPPPRKWNLVLGRALFTSG